MQRRIDVGNAEDPKAMCSADTPGPKPSDVYPNFSPGYNIIEGADRNDPGLSVYSMSLVNNNMLMHTSIRIIDCTIAPRSL